MAAETLTELKARLAAAESELEKLKQKNVAQDTDTYKNQLSIIESINRELSRRNDYLDQEVKAAEKLQQIGKDLLDLTTLKAKQEQRNAENALETAIQEGHAADEIERKVKALNEANEAYNNLNRAREQGSKLANLLGIDESQKNSLTYQLFANPKDVMKGFSDEIQKAGGVTQAVFLSVAMKVQEATVTAFFAFDNAAASLNKATGAAGSLNNVLAETARGSTRFGISFEEAGKATEALYNNLNTFNSLNVSAQKELITSAAKLEQLGISSADSAKSIATLSQIMGQSDVQSAKTVNQMAALGIAIGKSPQQITQDFSQAAGSLAGYGDRMVDVFKDLEVQSKATGVAVGDLIGIVEKFQSFEGAATAAGKLNAALGGNFINTMELLEASAENPAKAIDLIRSRLDEAGMSFNEMSFFEKKMIADAAGFKSIEEASRVLSMTNAEREKTAKADAERADAQKKLDEAIQASIPIQQKFQMIMANFAIVFAPAIDVVHGFANALLSVADNGFAKFIIGAMGVILVGVGIVKTFTLLVGGIKALLAPFGLFTKAAAAAGPAVTKTSAELAAAAPGFATFGAALIEVGLGAALVGVGMVGFGYGLKLAFDGISNLLTSIVTLSDVLTGEFTLSLIGLGFAMTLFANPLAILGMTAFAIALSSIVETINELDKDKSLNFSVITKSLTEATTMTTAVNNVGQQTKDMVDAINTFSLSNTQANNLANILKSLPQNQPAPAAPASNQVVEVYIGQEKLTNLVTRIVNRQTVGTIGTPTTLAPGGRTR